MAQCRQVSGNSGARNSAASDLVSIGGRGAFGSRRPYHRRSRPVRFNISTGLFVLTLFLLLSISAFFYFSLQSKGRELKHQVIDDGVGYDMDFLMNVTQIPRTKDLKFGNGSIARGHDSRYWDKDDRRRDEDYREDLVPIWDHSMDNAHPELKNATINSFSDKPKKVLDHGGNGLHTEDGHNELEIYEAEYKASDAGKNRELDDEEYNVGTDLQDDKMEEFDNVEHKDKDTSKVNAENADKASTDLYNEESLSHSQHSRRNDDSEMISFPDDQPLRRSVPEKKSGSRKKPKHQNLSGSCEMKVLDSSALIFEPLESHKFATFSLQYLEIENNNTRDYKRESRFAGRQSLSEREDSFIAHDQKINCGFVRGPKGSPSTGFDLAEGDAKYISDCHITVVSCIFGNSDHLRSPTGKTVSSMSRKNVCFVMFVDEVTLQTLSSEGQTPDMMGFVGLWKIVVVRNLPYSDMRRVGKIPKLLPHRVFPSARYSIWLDSKLRLQLDPLVILEYFLWRKGYEYAISNHYHRHCLWQEVAQNKRLNKYNRTVIDEQFVFYQADGMKRFNASDPDKLLPSNVPEGSFIVRAHSPMSNLFSCLWFNEVERFTPRDQLSFAYTYHKLRKKNPQKPFYLNMFKDCERRKTAKLYRHRSPEKRKISQHQTL